METCPICNIKMYQTIFQRNKNVWLCPVHALFTDEEKEASSEYFQFKWDLFCIEGLNGYVASINKNENNNIQILTDIGYSNAKELIQKRIDGYENWIRIAQIASLKIAVGRYAINKGYKDIKEMCLINKKIINKHSIQFRKNSISYPSMDLLKSVRDYVEHPTKEVPDEIMKALMANVPIKDDPLSFLYEEVITGKLGNNKLIYFPRGSNKTEKNNFFKGYIRSRGSHTSEKRFLGFLRDEIRDTILDIDKN